MAAETRRSDAVRPLQVDVADPRSITAAAAMIRQDYDQQLACLINNGGCASGMIICCPTPK